MLPLENLLLVPLPDGKYKEYIVVYHLTASEKEKISAGLPVDTKGKTEITELTNGTYNGSGQLARMVCTTTTNSYWAPCSGQDHHDGLNYQDCPIYNGTQSGTPPIFYTIITTTCLEQNYDIITPVDPGAGGGGGGGSSTTPPNPPANNNPPCTGTTIPPTRNRVLPMKTDARLVHLLCRIYPQETTPARKQKQCLKIRRYRLN